MATTPASIAVAAPPRGDATLAAINRRNARRLLPVLMLGYVLNTLDKANIGFAALEMNAQLRFTPAVFGLGAGLFFLTYTLFEIPSNLMLRRMGARLWLSRILVSWGIVSMAMALTWSRESFYALRLLLGIAEAGWYPGVLFFLTLWFTRDYRARATTLFVLGGPVSLIVGGPVSGALLSLPPVAGLQNWQWLFILEGLPAVLLGVVAYLVLRDAPARAPWLNREEKRRLAEAQEREQAGAAVLSSRSGGFAGLLAFLCLINFANALALYGTVMWLPRAVKELGRLTNLQTGFAAAVPFLFGAAMLIVTAWSSDRFGERKRHAAALLLVGGAGMAATATASTPLASLACLTVAIAGGFGVQGVVFALFAERLSRAGRAGARLAAALAAITTVGNLGGFVGPWSAGVLLERTGSFAAALLLIAGSFAVAGLLIALLPADRRYPADA